MNPHRYFSDLEKHLRALVSFASITPEDSGCQNYLQKILESIGFHCQKFPKNHCANLYAEIGTEGPLLVFAGHTDVVEPGPLSLWNSDPFSLIEHEGIWYGRGVADMKGSIVAMLVATLHWKPKNCRLGFLLTSAEEGSEYQDGTPYVMAKLKEQGKIIDYCIVGEPSSSQRSGDTIKIGRRGSLTGRAKVLGKQGHVAYPHLAQNAIHKALPFLNEISQLSLDEGDTYFPPSSLQITRVDNQTKATNIIPGLLEFDINIRFNPLQTSEILKKYFEKKALEHQLNIEWHWELSGEPFYTKSEFLINRCQLSIEKYTQRFAELSTSGGTSDGRFIAPYGIPVIELGLPNMSIHQPNEHIRIEDIILLTEIYLDILQNI
jgi:succinyl-diaminopimelate desuccinylase